MASGNGSLSVAVAGTSFGCQAHVRTLRAAGFEVAVLVGRDIHGLENRKKGDADGFR